jgi:hypothetical protein
MPFFRRKAQVRPTISWPVESLREVPPPPPPKSPLSTKSTFNTSKHSSRRSDVSYSTAATVPSYRSSVEAQSLDHSCEIDLETYFEQFRDEFDITDNCPDATMLEEAGEIPIYDSEGNSRPFKSLYSGDEAIGEQQLVIFVRHFFCGVRYSFFQPYCALKS